MAYLYLAITFLLFVGLFFRLVLQLAMRKMAGAKRTAVFGLIWGGVYALLLIGYGLFSRPHQLAAGELRCFDEWCITLVKADPTPSGFHLTLETSNRGRRAQRPDTPKLFLSEDGVLRRLPDEFLKERVDGGATRQTERNVEAPSTAKNVNLIAVEGGSPSLVVVDDENSPFHAKSFWRLK